MSNKRLHELYDEFEQVERTTDFEGFLVDRIAELETALREIVLYAKPKYRSTRDKLVRDGICLSGSLMHYEVMTHVITAGKKALEQTNEQ